VLVYFPVVWQSYRESGDDSGPPQITFGEYLRQHGFALEFWAFLVAGLVTAMLYWSSGQSIDPQRRSTEWVKLEQLPHRPLSQAVDALSVQ
jgi:hypothetical protein